jgi:mannose-1-phosphate guanylyltransferase/mannose-6-phosphate isomerase-like protein (cupin superfamily)
MQPVSSTQASLSQGTFLPVILAGGSGTRLWPSSSHQRPKQFAPDSAGGTDIRTPFRKTLELASRWMNVAHSSDTVKTKVVPPLIMCAASHRGYIAEQSGSIPIGAILLESVARDTLVAATVAAHHAIDRYGPETILVLFSTSHQIQPYEEREAFAGSLTLAFKSAFSSNRIMVFSDGATARTKPEPELKSKEDLAGGPIESKDSSLSSWSAFSFLGFGGKKHLVPKVPVPAAPKPSSIVGTTNVLNSYFDQLVPLIGSGITWHTGIVICRASVLLAEVARLEPFMGECAHRSLQTAQSSGTLSSDQPVPIRTLDIQSLARSTRISLESFIARSYSASICQISLRWQSNTDWGTAVGHLAKDSNGNILAGDGVLTVGLCSDNVVMTTLTKPDGLALPIALVGMHDAIVSASSSGVLITNRAGVSEVGRVPLLLAASRAAEPSTHETEPLAGLSVTRKATDYTQRPWGGWKILISAEESRELDASFQVKLLRLNPGKRISLQTHAHRSEHWYVVRGSGKATLARHVRPSREGDSLNIEPGDIHRLENDGKVPLLVIEVQRGSYLGEDDIVRLEDDYGRPISALYDTGTDTKTSSSSSTAIPAADPMPSLPVVPSLSAGLPSLSSALPAHSNPNPPFVAPQLSLTLTRTIDPPIRVGPVFAVHDDSTISGRSTPDWPAPIDNTQSIIGSSDSKETKVLSSSKTALSTTVVRPTISSSTGRVSLMSRALAPQIPDTKKGAVARPSAFATAAKRSTLASKIPIAPASARSSTSRLSLTRSNASTPRVSAAVSAVTSDEHDAKIRSFCQGTAQEALAIAHHLSGPKATLITPIRLNPILLRMLKSDILTFTRTKSGGLWKTKL